MGKTKKVEDMNYFELLAWLGIGSSHPGGFPATKQNLDTLQITQEDYVLDAGCGSGLTACYLAKKTGAKIVGIDINPEMIEKARQRAEKERVSHLTEFKVGDVYSLPFANDSFDWIIAESVTVFLDKIKVFKEFYRVIKPQGQVADHEMAMVRELPPNLRQQLKQHYGPDTNPLYFAEWHNALSQAGFENVEIKNAQPLKPSSNLVLNELKNDWLMLKDLNAKIRQQPGLIPRLRKSADFIKRNQHYFGFGLIHGQKPLPDPFKVRLWKWLQKKWPFSQ